MTTIPAEKFEEWINEYNKIRYDNCLKLKSCKWCQIKQDDDSFVGHMCMELPFYLSIKSKEYTEASQ